MEYLERLKNSRLAEPRSLVVASAVVLVMAVVVAIAERNQSYSSAATVSVPHVAPQAYDSRIGQASSAATTFNLKIDGTSLVSGPSNILVHTGDSVVVNITAAGDEIKASLAGYDITTEANPQAPGGFMFVADTVGTFPFYALEEKEDPSDTTPPREFYLGSIEVQ